MAGIIITVSFLVFIWAAVGIVRPRWARLNSRRSAALVWLGSVVLLVAGMSMLPAPPGESARADAADRVPRRELPVERDPLPEPILEVSTDSDLQRERICPEPDTYIVQVQASGDNTATVVLSLDDGGGGDGLGTVVEAVMRFANQSRFQSSPPLDLDGCYWLSAQTGIAGVSATARLRAATSQERH